MRYFATQVTEENIDEMIELGAQHKFNLTHARLAKKENSILGMTTFLIMTTNDKDVVLAFNLIPSWKFRLTWKFSTDTTGPLTQIVKI